MDEMDQEMDDGKEKKRRALSPTQPATLNLDKKTKNKKKRKTVFLRRRPRHGLDAGGRLRSKWRR